MGHLYKIFENTVNDDIVYVAVNQAGADYYFPSDESGNPDNGWEDKKKDFDEIMTIFDKHGEALVLSHNHDKDDLFEDGVYKMTVAGLRAAVEESGIDPEYLTVGTECETHDGGSEEPYHEIKNIYSDVYSVIWEND